MVDDRRKKEEIILQIQYRLTEELHARKRAEDKVHLLQSLSEIINKADNVHNALMGILNEVCEVTFWAIGEAWVPSEDRTFLELGAWCCKDAGLEPFKKVTEKTTFALGEGLPGKAWASKKSESMQDVSTNLHFLRRNAAREAGLKTSVSIPVLADDEVVVVLTFFLIEVSKVDEDFIDLITAVAYQLGSLIQRKLAEYDLKVSEEKFRSLFEDSKDAIYINTRDGRFIEVNQAMLDLFGYTREELEKIKADELYVNRDDRKRAQQEIDDEGNIKDFEVNWRRKDGTEIVIILTSTGQKGEDGTVVGYQGIIHDITDRKKAEMELKKKHEMLVQTNEELRKAFKMEEQLRDKLVTAEKLASLGEMAAKIAHEINNPLTVVKAQAEIKARDTIDPELKDAFTVIGQKADQIREMTRGYMNLAKPTSIEMKDVKLGDILKATINSLRPLGQLKHVELVESYPEDEPSILGDSSRLEQVFRNLILNAVDATVGVVHKKITAGIKLAENGKAVEAFISDNGVGIKPENLDKIFEHYYSTKERGTGTGLGLVIAREITEQLHGGGISVESVFGEGTTFHVIIPISEHSKMKKKILIADDEAYLTDLFGQFFTKKGLIVRTANNGEDAFEIYSNFAPDVVLSDIVMPGMDGLTLLNKIRDINPKQRIVMMTAYASKSEAKKLLEEMGVHLILKPPDLENELWKIVNEELEKIE